MKDFINSQARAAVVLAKMFLEIVASSDDVESLERGIVDLGHDCMTEALGLMLGAKATP